MTHPLSAFFRRGRLAVPAISNYHYTWHSGRCKARPGPLLAVLLALVLAGAGCDRTPSLAPLPATGVILAFGDSLTAGTGAAAGLSYPAQLQDLVGRQVINAGIPGELSSAGLSRLPELLDRERPDLLILCHGGNDLLRRTGEAQAEANLRQMIEEASNRGIGVVLIGVPRPGLLLDAAPFYRKLAAEFKLPLLEDHLGEILADRDLKSDAIHPNAAGYLQLAEGLAALLKKGGAL